MQLHLEELQKENRMLMSAWKVEGVGAAVCIVGGYSNVNTTLIKLWKVREDVIPWQKSPRRIIQFQTRRETRACWGGGGWVVEHNGSLRCGQSQCLSVVFPAPKTGQISRVFFFQLLHTDTLKKKLFKSSLQQTKAENYWGWDAPPLPHSVSL